jgi:hypothetical protein
VTSLAVRYDRGSPVIVIQNRSRIPHAELAHVVRALQTQVDRDFFPLWGWRARLLLDPKKAPRRAMKIVVKGKDSDDDFGYHFIAGVPITYVFTERADGTPIEEYASTLSHEVLEMIVDPGVNLFALGFYVKAGKRRDAFIPYEVCDAVQENLYSIDGVKVSDFVVPEWFEPGRKRRSQKFSFRGSVQGPFELAENGYIDAMVGQSLRTVWGEAANKKKRRHRHKARKARLR